MRLEMMSLTTIVVIFLLGGPVSAAKSQVVVLRPAQMSVFVVTDEDIVRPVYGTVTQPRTLRWAGPKYRYFEGPPSSSLRDANISIRNGSDFWAINSVSGRGVHWRDTMSPDIAGVRLYGPPEDSEIVKLEFGMEKEFFASHRANFVDTLRVGAVSCEEYQLTINLTTLRLYINRVTGKPVKISLKGPNGEYSTRYLRYEVGLPFDSTAFLPAPSIEIKDIPKPRGPGR
jgi:hypothetical protein